MDARTLGDIHFRLSALAVFRALLADEVIGALNEALARAAVATGVDGVFMETHLNPKVALSDAANAIAFRALEDLWRRLVALNEIVRRPKG